MGFRKTWLEEHGLAKFRVCRGNISRLEQNQPEIIVGFGEFRIAAYEIPEDIDCASNVVVLPEDKAKLDAGIRVPGIKTDGFVQLARLLFGEPLLHPCRTEFPRVVVNH